MGVDPDHRGHSVGRRLYDRFFELAGADNRSMVRAVTSPVNSGSIAFHQRMGFDVSEPIEDYDGPGITRVQFSRRLDARHGPG